MKRERPRNAGRRTRQAAPQRTLSPLDRDRAIPRRADGVPPLLLQLGTAALREALRFSAPADAVLRHFFRAHPKLGRRDRGFIAEAVFCVLRRLRGFTQLAGERKLRRLFILGAQLSPESIFDLRAGLGTDEVAWLDTALAEDSNAAPLGIRAELPDWVIERLRRHHSDDDILALGVAMQRPAPLDLRVNSLRASRESALAALRESGISAEPTRYSPVGLRLAGKPALETHPLYESGAIEVQDEGSQLLGFLLSARRREMVVDFCAGAGGKTLLVGAQMRSEGRLYAFDVAPQRIHRLRKRVARAGLSNVQAEVLAHENDTRLKRLAGKIDRVLVDAPCTGFGTLRRNPDLKWRQTENDLAALQEKQTCILDAAVKLLKPGGRLTYATCSFLAEENDAIADAFQQRHPAMTELDCEEILSRQGIAIPCGPRLRLSPQLHGTDGFFSAVFEKS